jgi:hypothetical protein
MVKKAKNHNSYIEHFDSIQDMIATLNSRTNNQTMQDCDSSHEGSSSFTGTSSYEEAEKLLKTGFGEIIQTLKTEIKKEEKLNTKKYGTRNRFYYKNNVEGVLPNIPNALMGLPNSMILPSKKIEKTKAIDLYYDMGACCGIDRKEWIAAGVKILVAVKIFELQNISVNLNCCFYSGFKHGQYLMASVKLKGYQDKLDLLKLCFPIAHPSFFRRFGFKWLETVPIENLHYGFASGYGQALHSNEDGKIWELPKQSCYIRFNWLKDETFENLINNIKTQINEN